MAKPAVILVGADKGGVGKTTVSRTLIDYFLAHHVPIRAFDTEAPKGTLKRFHPDITEIVDITKVPDQMKIFDTLNSAQATVTLLDVRAGMMSPTLQALKDFGFIEAAKKGQITFVLFHILGPNIASLDEIADTAEYLGDARYFLVKNFINNDTQFFDWDEDTHKHYLTGIKDAVEVTVPTLNEMATEQVDVASVPFVTFIGNKKPSGEAASYSFVLRGYVRHWLGNVWAEYDRIKLTDIVAAKAPSDETAPRPKPQAVEVPQQRPKVQANG
jgi:hypothetical protein